MADYMGSSTAIVEGEELSFSIFGRSGPAVLLVHATLMARSMQRPLAEILARRGYRVVTVDLIGKPLDHVHPSERFSSDKLAARLLALLDKLAIDKFHVAGSSVGSAIALELALQAPERVQSMVLEGPFLEDGTGAAAHFWSPGLWIYGVGRPLLGPVSRGLARVPRRRSPIAEILLDFLGQDPAAAHAYLRGMFSRRMFPSPDERRTITTPALVLGFRIDPFHPLSDARRLHGELDECQLLIGGSILDLRLRPDRFAAAIGDFFDRAQQTSAPTSKPLPSRRLRSPLRHQLGVPR